ncbi:hypothetical protein [Burkholderia pseudomallei]|nr:hypothetical protein [Burkholderia pseudomallei]
MSDLKCKSAEPAFDAVSGQDSLPLTARAGQNYLLLSLHSATPTCIPS